MKCFFKCACQPEEIAVEVPDRTEGQDVGDWVGNTVGLAIGEEHRRRSPFCRRATTEYVKIPMPENAPFIGGKPRLDS